MNKKLLQENIQNKIVLKTLEIIDYFNPTWWFIENPQTGKLKDGLYNLNSSGSWFFTYINEEFEWV